MTAVRAGLMGKVAVGSLVASPLVMFLGMAMGYWLHKESQALRDLPEPMALPRRTAAAAAHRTALSSPWPLPQAVSAAVHLPEGDEPMASAELSA